MSKFLKQFGFVALLLIIIVGISGCSKNARKNAEMNKDDNEVNLEIIGKDNGVIERRDWNSMRSNDKMFSPFGFAILRKDGSIASWGSIMIGRSMNRAPEDKGYVNLIPLGTDFGAIKKDGSIAVWGYPRIEKINTPTDKGYVNIFSTAGAFAAIKEDGSVTSWGDFERGGKGAPTDNGYIDIFSTIGAFAALKKDGSVTSWNIEGTSAYKDCILINSTFVKKE